MPTARTYENWEIVKEPFFFNNKWYVGILNPKTGFSQNVRWYTDEQYTKMYGEAPKNPTPQYVKTNQRFALGFSEGPITIFRGNTYKYLDWFRFCPETRYCKLWGWYVVSTEKVPEDLPEELTPVTLCWETVGNEDGSLMEDETVRAAVSVLLNGQSESEYVGEVGERLELTITVKRNIQIEGNYGTNNMHIMEDENHNVFVWSTQSKSWPEGSTHTIRGTVKDHRDYLNVHQTILTRCIERK